MLRQPALALAAGALALAAGPGLAADAADRAIIGFSGDGRWFAYEEYGVQDGSGFPYATVTVVDLDRNEWAPGTPVRVRVDNETATVHDARRKALTESGPIIEKLGAVEPGKVLASNAVGEVVADPHAMEFRRFHNIDDTFVVKLEVFALPRPAGCLDDGRPVVGLALLAGPSGGSLAEVHRDDTVPASRGCPLGYRLADVIGFGNDRLVIMVHTLAAGFEGLDARFLAVPARVPPP